MNRKKKIYLDYAAATPVDPRVLKEMNPYFCDEFGNPSSIHSLGLKAKEVLEKSRKIIANSLNAKPGELIFTGSATESNNFALKGIAFANIKKGKHIIISTIEHKCILNIAKWLEEQGFEIDELKVDKKGLIDLKELERLIRKDTILVSIMHANNEIGVIEPIEQIGQICHKHNVYFHTDVAQSFGKIPIDVYKMNIDLLTTSSHKMYGPKGVACLYLKSGVIIDPILHGGGQERGLRSSTMNISAIVGFSKAVEIYEKERKKENEKLTKLRDRLIKGILDFVPNSHLNGDIKKRLSNNVNFTFDFVEGESVLMELDFYGILCSTSSACGSSHLEPSHVLLAIGLSPGQANSSIRFSLGRWTNKKEIDYVLKILPKVIKKLRKISPFKK